MTAHLPSEAGGPAKAAEQRGSINRRAILKGAGAIVAVDMIAPVPGLAAATPAAALPTATGEAALTAQELALIASMSEGIIPRTDTPGAIAAGVPAFFVTIFNEWFLKDQQIAFRASLKGYDEDARRTHGKPFLACAASQQLDLLREWDRQAAGGQARPAHPFLQFKTLTLHGYYTSQAGMDEELRSTMDGAQDDPNGPVMYGVAGRL